MLEEVPHHLWHRPRVAGHLAAFDLPAVLRELAAEPGWSQDVLACYLGYTQPTLSRIMSGRRALKVDEALRLIRELRIPLYLVGVGGLPEEMSPTDRRSFGRLATGTALTAFAPGKGSVRDSAELLHSKTAHYAAVERERGGNVLCPVLAREVNSLTPIVRDHNTPQLLSAFGELCGLTGYAHYDAQQHLQADYFFALGLQAAHESGNQALLGQLRALMSMRATWQDKGVEGASHCAAALDSLLHLPPTERAMLLGRQARAEALQGNREEVYRLIGTSREIQSEASTRQPLIAYWSNTEIYGNAGIAYKDIGEYTLAEQNVRKAIDSAGPRDKRDATLYLGILSRIYIKTKRYEEAAATVDEIISTSVISNRTTHQLNLFKWSTRLIKSATLDDAKWKINRHLSS